MISRRWALSLLGALGFVAAPTVLRPSNAKAQTEGPPLLEYLFNLGRQTGDAWIAQNGDALGQRSTMDLQQLLPGTVGR
jgi:hypothetical protein